MFFGNFIRIFRWWFLFNDKKSSVSLKDSISLFFIGQSLNLIMPAGTGDVIKGYFGGQKSGMKEKMYSISLIDKIIAISSNAVLIGLVLIMSFDFKLLIVGVLCIIPLIVFYFLESLMRINLFHNLSSTINNRLTKIDLFQLFKFLRMSPYKIFTALVISAIAWVVTYSILLYCFEMAGTTTEFMNVFKNIPYMSLGRLFPLTLNGIGSDESIAYFLFKPFIDSKETIFISALLFRLFTNIIPGIIGLPILAFYNKAKYRK